MLSEFKIKTKSNNEINQNLKSIIMNDPKSITNSNIIKNALNNFIGNSNLLKPKKEKENFNYLQEKKIIHVKKEKKKRIPKIDLLNYPFNNLVETNSISFLFS